MSLIWKQPERKQVILIPTMLLVNSRGRVLETDKLRGDELLKEGFQEAPKGANVGDYLKEFDVTVPKAPPKGSGTPPPAPEPKKAAPKKAAKKKSK
jgi:hypothetical protein